MIKRFGQVFKVTFRNWLLHAELFYFLAITSQMITDRQLCFVCRAPVFDGVHFHLHLFTGSTQRLSQMRLAPPTRRVNVKLDGLSLHSHVAHAGGHRGGQLHHNSAQSIRLNQAYRRLHHLGVQGHWGTPLFGSL